MSVNIKYVKPKARLEDVQVNEVSLVPRGANRFPLLLIKRKVQIKKGSVPFRDFPKADESKTWDGDAAVSNLREWASSDGSGEKEKIDWAKYRTAFLWYDSDDPENFGSYKMPVLDIFGGDAKVVWKAVVSALGAVQGARGGVDVPEEEKDSILQRLKSHYEQFGKEWPLEKECKEKSKSGGNIDFFSVDGSGEQRIVTGVVLVPNRFDGQDDITTEKVIRKAAYDFMVERQKPKISQKNKAELGVMHSSYDKELELVESYVALADIEVGKKVIKKGSWVVTFRILDDEVWSKVKKGEFRGFSIKGSGRGRRLQ